MKVFISFGNIADQVTALRFQALGVVNGLSVFVPPAYTRQGPPVLEDDVSAKLREADVVLGLVETGLAASCRLELDAAVSAGKKVTILCSPQFAPSFPTAFESNLVIIDPTDPDKASIETVRHLKALATERNAQKALVGIGLLALGLLIVSTSGRN